MRLVNHNPHRNLLLAAMEERQLARLRPDLEPMALEPGQVLESPGEPIAHVCFPESGMGSVVAVGAGGQRIEAGVFGREGMSGLAVVLGSDRSPHETHVQAEGAGHRVRADALREAMADEPAIRERLLRYAQAFAVQLAHTTLAQGRHSRLEQLARWLLMRHDRVEGDLLVLSHGHGHGHGHGHVALMLGMHRAGVSLALRRLGARGLVRASRKRICILDRAGLEALAHGSYGGPEAEYARLMGAERPADRLLDPMAGQFGDLTQVRRRA